MKVTVKFCGHCSPRMDMWDLFTKLKKECERFSETIRFVFYMNDTEGDVLLIMCACQAACAETAPFDGRVIRVCPGQIDYWPVPEEEMCGALCRMLRGNQ